MQGNFLPGKGVSPGRVVCLPTDACMQWALTFEFEVWFLGFIWLNNIYSVHRKTPNEWCWGAKVWRKKIICYHCFLVYLVLSLLSDIYIVLTLPFHQKSSKERKECAIFSICIPKGGIWFERRNFMTYDYNLPLRYRRMLKKSLIQPSADFKRSKCLFMSIWLKVLK